MIFRSVPTKQTMPVQGGGSEPASKYYPTTAEQAAIGDDERTRLNVRSPGPQTTNRVITSSPPGRSTAAERGRRRPGCLSVGWRVAMVEHQHVAVRVLEHRHVADAAVDRVVLEGDAL